MVSGRIKALSLYKNILRAHDRFLPSAMKQLGDAYVKAEFRLHKTAETEQVKLFFTEWDRYLEHIERTGRETQAIDAGLLDHHKSSPLDNGVHTNNNDHEHTNNNSGPSFGKDVPSDVELNDEQKTQLKTLREEAVKAGGEART